MIEVGLDSDKVLERLLQLMQRPDFATLPPYVTLRVKRAEKYFGDGAIEKALVQIEGAEAALLRDELQPLLFCSESQRRLGEDWVNVVQLFHGGEYDAVMERLFA